MAESVPSADRALSEYIHALTQYTQAEVAISNAAADGPIESVAEAWPGLEGV